MSGPLANPLNTHTGNFLASNQGAVSGCGVTPDGKCVQSQEKGQTGGGLRYGMTAASAKFAADHGEGYGRPPCVRAAGCGVPRVQGMGAGEVANPPQRGGGHIPAPSTVDLQNQQGAVGYEVNVSNPKLNQLFSGTYADIEGYTIKQCVGGGKRKRKGGKRKSRKGGVLPHDKSGTQVLLGSKGGRRTRRGGLTKPSLTTQHTPTQLSHLANQGGGGFLCGTGFQTPKTPTKGFRRGSPSKTHPGELDFTTKKSSELYDRVDRKGKRHRYRHPRGSKKNQRPYSRRKRGGSGRAGTKSKTHKGRINYRTGKRDTRFHRGRHFQKHAQGKRKTRRPYRKGRKGGSGKAGTKSKTNKGRINYRTGKRDTRFHRGRHFRKHAQGKKKTRRPYRKAQRGGYSQYQSDVAFTPSLSIPGVAPGGTWVTDGMLAQPPPITRTNHCNDQYNHFTGKNTHPAAYDQASSNATPANFWS